MADKESFPNSARLSEFWTLIKTLLAGKVDMATLESYPTVDAVATAISKALTNYATNQNVVDSITKALTEYMTASEVNEAILDAVKKIHSFKKEVVVKLPEVGDDDTIYLVPSDNPSEKDTKIEYIWVNGEYERIGSTTANLDQYWNKEELRVMTAEELKEILV